MFSSFLSRAAAQSKEIVVPGFGTFGILSVDGCFAKLIQIKDSDGVFVLEVNPTLKNKKVDTSKCWTAFPADKGFIIHESHVWFESLRAEFADLDNRTLAICPQCEGNGVTMANFGDACDACVANLDTISTLKTMV